MEKDDEIKGEGNSYDFGARMLDVRIGRWFALDPFMDEYPSMSPYCYVANMPTIASDPNGKEVIIRTTTSSYNGKIPTKIGEIAVTNGGTSFSYNRVTKVWDIILTNHIQYSAAFRRPGRNRKTLEQENPGLLVSSQKHEDVHVKRNIRAVKSSISYTTNLLDGGAQTFTGTADIVMTNIFNAYTLQRGVERENLVKAQVAKIQEQYTPLIANANGDLTKITELKAQAQSQFDAFANDTLKTFDQQTTDNVKALATRVLAKVGEKMNTLNVHEGTNGVNTEASNSMQAGSNSKKYQDGQLPIKSQGQILQQ